MFAHEFFDIYIYSPPGNITKYCPPFQTWNIVKHSVTCNIYIYIYIYIHILKDWSTGTGAIVWLKQHHRRSPGGWFNIKMTSYQYRKSHCGDKTILRPSYLHSWISYTDKISSLYCIMALKNMDKSLCAQRQQSVAMCKIVQWIIERNRALCDKMMKQPF